MRVDRSREMLKQPFDYAQGDKHDGDEKIFRGLHNKRKKVALIEVIGEKVKG